MSYDSRPDTLAHIRRVGHWILQVTESLQRRAEIHDASKLVSPEVEVFDRVTPKLKELTYGSDEYKASLADMGEALRHHYAHNRHHPEHWPNGINDMNLVDIMEMLADWMAAVERHADGDIHQSIDLNAKRFGYSSELAGLLHRTAATLLGTR